MTGPSRWTPFRRCRGIVRRSPGKKRSRPDSARCACLGAGRTTRRECWPVSSCVVDAAAAAFGGADAAAAAGGVDYVGGISNDCYL